MPLETRFLSFEVDLELIHNKTSVYGTMKTFFL